MVAATAATGTATATASRMAQAILLSDVAELGARGSVVEVSKGYLRNYLIPRRLAQPATAGALAAASQQAAAADRAARHAAEQAEETAAVLSRTVLTIAQQAGDDGRLFGSVTPQDIVDAISESRGLALDRRGVALEEPIKNVGTYMVVVEVSPGVSATVKTIVTAA